MALNLRFHGLLRCPLLHRTPLYSLGLVALSTLLSPKAIAQVAADTTLSNPSNISFDGSTYDITDGVTNGTNLFHSFESFSLTSGETAQFSNDTAIENIIGRVTGASTSRINGLIEANGNANLFLLNPNGVVFGPNAELNIGGSFLATTADSFLFDEGEFSAIDPQEPPLLAINTPLGLQFGANPGPIRVNGPGNGLFIDPDFFDVVRSDRPSGLEVSEGQTLALVGGKLIFNGGNVTASQGRIELGSVGQDERVLLSSDGEGWVLNYEQVSEFDTIRLRNAASADVSGEGGGDVQVFGQTLQFTDGSAVIANTLGAEDGGSVTLQASEAIAMEATSLDDDGLARLPSGVFAEVSIGSTGSGATVSVNSPQLTLSDGAQISVGTFSQGDAGSVTVVADDITIVRDALFTEDESYLSSGLVSVADVDATGQSGTINIDTNTLTISEFAQIAVSTFGEGNGGTLVIEADEISLDQFAGIYSNADTIDGVVSTGNGGDIVINADTFRLTFGGQVASTAFSGGDGGSIDITTRNLELVGDVTDVDTLIATDVFDNASGNGGSLNVKTDSLIVTEGAQLLASTAGGGNAGELTIEADTIELNGSNPFGRSGLVATAVIDEGDGGNINVTTNQLTIVDGATINVGNFSTQSTTQPGSGESGNIVIDADVLQLDDDGSISASSLNGLGDININSETIVLNQRSNITTNALGQAPGGNVRIDATTLVGLENSNITANAVNNRGGQIVITADTVLGFQISNSLTPEFDPSSDITASSSLGANFRGTVELNSPEAQPAQWIVNLSGNFLDRSTLLSQVCTLDEQDSTLMLVGAGGSPPDPTQFLAGRTLWIDLRLSEQPNLLSHDDIGETLQRSELNKLDAHIFSNAFGTRITEVTGWIRHHEGLITLAAPRHPKITQDIRPCPVQT